MTRVGMMAYVLQNYNSNDFNRNRSFRSVTLSSEPRIFSEV